MEEEVKGRPSQDKSIPKDGKFIGKKPIEGGQPARPGDLRRGLEVGKKVAETVLPNALTPFKRSKGMKAARVLKNAASNIKNGNPLASAKGVAIASGVTVAKGVKRLGRKAAMKIVKHGAKLIFKAIKICISIPWCWISALIAILILGLIFLILITLGISPDDTELGKKDISPADRAAASALSLAADSNAFTNIRESVVASNEASRFLDQELNKLIQVTLATYNSPYPIVVAGIGETCLCNENMCEFDIYDNSDNDVPTEKVIWDLNNREEDISISSINIEGQPAELTPEDVEVEEELDTSDWKMLGDKGSKVVAQNPCHVLAAASIVSGNKFYDYDFFRSVLGDNTPSFAGETSVFEEKWWGWKWMSLSASLIPSNEESSTVMVYDCDMRDGGFLFKNGEYVVSPFEMASGYGGYRDNLTEDEEEDQAISPDTIFENRGKIMLLSKCPSSILQSKIASSILDINNGRGAFCADREPLLNAQKKINEANAKKSEELSKLTEDIAKDEDFSQAEIDKRNTKIAEDYDKKINESIEDLRKQEDYFDDAWFQDIDQVEDGNKSLIVARKIEDHLVDLGWWPMWRACRNDLVKFVRDDKIPEPTDFRSTLTLMAPHSAYGNQSSGLAEFIPGTEEETIDQALFSAIHVSLCTDTYVWLPPADWIPDDYWFFRFEEGSQWYSDEMNCETLYGGGEHSSGWIDKVRSNLVLSSDTLRTNIILNELPTEWWLENLTTECPTGDILDDYHRRGQYPPKNAMVNGNVHPCMEEAFNALLGIGKASGIELRAGGFRSIDHQRELRSVYDRCTSYCPPVATPGKSRHQFGLAFDFVYNAGKVKCDRYNKENEEFNEILGADISCEEEEEDSSDDIEDSEDEEFNEIDEHGILDGEAIIGGREIPVGEVEEGFTLCRKAYREGVYDYATLCHYYLSNVAPRLGLLPFDVEPWHWSIDGR